MEIYNSHFPAFEINLGKETFGREYWQIMYDYPVIGLSYWYSHLGNSEMLGSAHAIFPYVNYPLFSNEKQEFNFRLGLGLAYLTKKYERLTNYKYIAIGSHVNVAGNFNFEYRYRVSSRLQTAIGLSLMHFSNGSTKTPNYGINIPSMNIALAYRLSEENSHLQKNIMPNLYKFEFPENKFVGLKTLASIGYKDMGNEYDRKFFIYNFSLDFQKQIAYKSLFGAGVDITHHGADYFLVDYKNVEHKNQLQILRIGINGNYELRMDKLSYGFAVGYYVNGIMKPNELYFKLSLNYDITDHLYTGISLRSEFARADFVGLGIGYKFNFAYGEKKQF